MALTPGARLGVYEVIASIGEGGMGQVFRARDTKLDRDVAIKILPEAFAHDADRLARFQREAKTLASLNHPNIAGIYGLEESGGVTALVMELVEGEDLSQRIARGAIPITEALSTAKQIAEALEAAHEQGVIHRDLKPANIKVREDGTVKVLDFGLAKAMEPTGARSSNVSQSPTITTPAMTQAGMILGTAAYMSPEQAKGRAADRRSDVWAFGVVLYEMLTGQRAFKGEDVPDTLAFILTREPDWTTLPADTPPLIRRLLRRCLEKERKRRLDSAADARLEIEEAMTAPSAVEAGAAQFETRSAWSRALTWTLAASTLGLAIALVLLLAPWRTSRGVEQTLVRLDVDLGLEVSLPAPGAEGPSVIISPDGTRLVYVNTSSGPARLFTRRLDQPRATDLEGTEGASGPFFSPDGRWVGFFARGTLNKVLVEGGLVVPLSDIPSVVGASWGDDGFVVAATASGGLFRIPSGGGAATPLTEPGNREYPLLPQVLPGGQAVLFLRVGGTGIDKQSVEQSIEVITVRDHRRKTLLRSATSPRYLPSGHLVYTKGATLFALAFDLDRLETRGTAVPVLEDVAFQAVSGLAQFDVSRNGTMVYRKDPASAVGMTRVQWLDASGKKDALMAKPAVFSAPRLSPDGKRLALLVLEGTNQGISIYDEQRESVMRLTSSAEVYRGPVWSPNGRHIIFSTPNGTFSIRADGAGPRQSLTPGFKTPASFTKEGKRLAYTEIDRANGGAGGIWTVSIEDDGNQLRAGKPEPFLQTPSTEGNPMFSPDGRWLAYQSDETGTNEVNVRAFPAPVSGQGSKWQISNSGGTRPIWSLNSHELLYRAGDQIMAVKYTVKGDAFVADKPRLWSKLEGAIDFDLAPDGKRLVVLTPMETPGAPRADHNVVFLQNFFDELRRLVPAGQ